MSIFKVGDRVEVTGWGMGTVRAYDAADDRLEVKTDSGVRVLGVPGHCCKRIEPAAPAPVSVETPRSEPLRSHRAPTPSGPMRRKQLYVSAGTITNDLLGDKS